MGKDAVDLLKWTNEDYAREYALIKEKKSKLPASQRKLIVELVENPIELSRKENTNALVNSNDTPII